MPLDPTGSDETFHAWMSEALERAAAGLDAAFCVLRAG